MLCTGPNEMPKLARLQKMVSVNKKVIMVLWFRSMVQVRVYPLSTPRSTTLKQDHKLVLEGERKMRTQLAAGKIL
jgi:hypothetical protein